MNQQENVIQIQGERVDDEVPALIKDLCKQCINVFEPSPTEEDYRQLEELLERGDQMISERMSADNVKDQDIEEFLLNLPEPLNTLNWVIELINSIAVPRSTHDVNK